MHETREFPYNYLVEEVLKSYELLHTYYQPVKVKVNGDNWGIMLIEEQYSDSFFAKSKINTTKNGNVEVEILKGQESFRIQSFIKSNIWTLLPSGKSKFKKGSIVDCFFPHHPNKTF